MGKDLKPDISAVKGAAKNNKPKEDDSETDSIFSAKKREERMVEAISYYKRKGTMVPFVNGYSDYSEDEKKLFLDDAMIRAKGKPPKNNPFGKEE